MKERIQFKGIDSWNRPVFKSLDKPRHYYGATYPLFGYGSTEYEVKQLVKEEDLSYFGSRFDCEPYGTPVDNLIIIWR